MSEKPNFAKAWLLDKFSDVYDERYDEIADLALNMQIDFKYNEKKSFFMAGVLNVITRCQVDLTKAKEE